MKELIARIVNILGFVSMLGMLLFSLVGDVQSAYNFSLLFVVCCGLAAVGFNPE